MRLSKWRTGAPHRDSMAPKVLALVDSVLGALGCEPDPHAWVAWGDDPSIRYSILAPTTVGLVVCHVRVNLAGEGPRANGKIVRWNRVQLGELGVETQGGHRLVTFQVEQQILRGHDAEADRVAAFAIALFAAADGRPLPDLDRVPGRRSSAGTSSARAAGGSKTAPRGTSPAPGRAAPAGKRAGPAATGRGRTGATRRPAAG